MPYLTQGDGLPEGGRVGYDGNTYDSSGNMIRTKKASPVNVDVYDADQRALDMQRQQYYEQQEMFQPYAALGTSALSNFGNYTQGENFAPQLRQGSNALAGSQAASGMLNSSNTGNRLSRFVNELTQEDMNRQYQQNINNVKIGQGAVGQIAAAGQSYGTNAGNVLSNQGNIASQNALNAGNNAAQWWNTAGQVGSGAFNYFAS